MSVFDGMRNWAISRLGGAVVTKGAGVPNFDPLFFKGGARPRGSSVELKEIMSKPYAFHTWVYSSTHIIANNLARLVNAIFVKDKQGNERPVFDHPIIKLLDNPNVFQTKTPFWESLVLGLMLPTTRTPGGQIFIVPDSGRKTNNGKVNLKRGEMPMFLFPYTDEIIHPIANKVTKELEAWKLVIPGKPEDKAVRYEFNEIIRIYLHNPYNPAQGQSPFSAAGLGVEQDFKADQFNTRSFDNDGQVGGILTSEQVLTKDQRREMLAAWMENHGGAAKTNGIAVLGAGLKYEQFVRTHLEMEFMKQKQWNKEEIMTAYGLNEVAFGLVKSINRATLRDAIRLLWMDTYKPIQDIIWETMNATWVSNVKPGNLFGDSDYSTVPAMREDFTEKVKTAVELIVKGTVPPAEAFRVLEIPIDSKKFPWLETVFINPLLADARTLVGSPGQPPKPKEDDIDKKLIGLGEKFKQLQIEEKASEENALVSDAYIRAVLDPGEKELKAVFERFFIDQRNAIQDLIDEWAKKNKDEDLVKMYTVEKEIVVNADDFLPDLFDENEKLFKVYEPTVKSQMIRETAKLEQELGGLVNWNVNPDNILVMFNKRKAALRKINDLTFAKIRNKVTDAVKVGIEQRLTVQELAKILKTEVGIGTQTRINNAPTIARTETGSISANTRFEAFGEEQIRFHKWLTARDENVRETHMAQDGQIREVGAPFEPSGLTYPLQSGGPPGEVISCRCVAVAAKEPK